MPGSPQITSEGQKVTKKSKVSICCTRSADFLEIMWVHQLAEVEEQRAEQPVRNLEARGKVTENFCVKKKVTKSFRF